MASLHTDGANGSRRSLPLWVLEALIVLGVLGFGYFAVALDAGAWIGAIAPLGEAHPLGNFAH